MPFLSILKSNVATNFLYPAGALVSFNVYVPGSNEKLVAVVFDVNSFTTLDPLNICIVAPAISSSLAISRFDIVIVFGCTSTVIFPYIVTAAPVLAINSTAPIAIFW